MDKKAVGACALVLLAAAAVLGNINLISVQGATTVSGAITSNTVWTRSSAPYTLTGPITIASGATLTIEPGVTVNVGEYYFTVDGAMQAVGSSREKIIFAITGNQLYWNDASPGVVVFANESSDWNELTHTGSIIENSVFNSSETVPVIYIQDSSPKVNNCTIASTQMNEGIQTIVAIYGGNSIISNNTISGDSSGILISSGNEGCNAVIERNLIFNNTGSPQIFGGGIAVKGAAGGTTSPLIQDNTIIENSVGINLSNNPTPIIVNNNIVNNTEFSFYLYNAAGGPNTQNATATNNWWGTNDGDAINATIHDFKYHSNLGNVTYIPFLTQPNPAAPSYFFTINATATNTTGNISPSGNIEIKYGGSQTFTIAPDVHCHIVDVFVDGVPVGPVTSYTFTDISAPHTISALIARDVCNITVSAGPNGAFSPSGVVAVDYGGNQTFTVNPLAHYHIVNVVVDGNSVGAVTSVTFTNVTTNHTLSATFAIDTFTLTAVAGSGGNINPSGTQTVNYGETLTYTITPNTGYQVANILVDGSPVGTSNSYTLLNIDANHTIIATFTVGTIATPAATETPAPTTSPSPTPSATTTPDTTPSYTSTPTTPTTPATTTPTPTQTPQATTAEPTSTADQTPQQSPSPQSQPHDLLGDIAYAIIFVATIAAMFAAALTLDKIRTKRRQKHQTTSF